ncbi:MAG: hypothetical protein EOO38_01535 [Cytophagaceae bacterium]|nr:MAG: hypothetical protein EOO38_01535 [Cytophagaceae bacterium]
MRLTTHKISEWPSAPPYLRVPPSSLRSTPLAMLGLRPVRGSAPLRGWPAARGLTCAAGDGLWIVWSGQRNGLVVLIEQRNSGREGQKVRVGLPLRKQRKAMADLLAIISKERLEAKLGRLDTAEMQGVERAIRLQLGLAT